MTSATRDAAYDLVVVGAGTAGLACAIEAADHGARVAVVEKSDDVGGTLHVSGGHLSAAGARRQRAAGISDTPEAHFDDVMRISRGTARADLVRRAVELAADTVDWLEDGGFDFAPRTPRIVHGHEPYGVARTVYGTDEARSILAVLRGRLAPHRTSGAVTLLLGTRVTALPVADDGRVTGVTAQGQDGPVTLAAPATVLATGGFAADAARFAALEGYPLFTAARPTSTGDGLDLAGPVGGAVAGRGQYLPTFGGLPDPADPGRVAWHDRPLLVATERPPVEVYVDRRGRRFLAEDEPSIDEKERRLAALDDLTFWVVLDEPGVDAADGVVVGWTPADLRAAAGARDGVHVAESVAELAVTAGIDPSGLTATVAVYNAAVAAGRDLEFDRRHLPAPIVRPPFYALRNHGTTLITFAGLDVDADLRVRREDGTVIPGLYAVGEVLGAAATSGNSFCGGMLLTPALAFGRSLGRVLAASAVP